MIFLKIPNVPKGMVFAEKITYVVPFALPMQIHTISSYANEQKVNVFSNNSYTTVPIGNKTLNLHIYVLLYQK